MRSETERTILRGLAALVVIIVAAIIFMPKFGGQKTGYRTACLSQMKAIGTGMAIYMGDHDDALPIAQSVVGPTAVGWAERIVPYTKNPDIFIDPVEIKELPEVEQKRPRVSYALNANAAASKVAWEAPSAARSILLYEIANSRLGRGGELHATLRLSPVGDGAIGGLLDSTDPNVPPVTVPSTGPLANSGLDPKSFGRHGGKSNFIHLDTHARAMAPEEVSAGANARIDKSPHTDRGCSRPDLPGIPRPCAEGVRSGTHRSTFSFR